MAPTLPAVTLQQAARIGLLGDVHGDVAALLDASEFLARADIHALIVLGDLGLLWPNGHWQHDVEQVSAALAGRGQTLYWVDGNHEAFDLLERFAVDTDGLRRITPQIIHLPRGYRTVLSSGKTLAALGGANSIDREFRGPTTWWPQESITPDDLRALGDASADVLIGHDAPLDVLSLDRALAETDHLWSLGALAYARQGRQMYHRALQQTMPALVLGGHYHRAIDETVGYVADQVAFVTRVVLLDSVQHSHTASAAILTVDTLSLDYFTYYGEPLPLLPAQVTDFALTEVTGAWMIHTTGSRHRIDLDAGTIERIPGPDTHPTTSDGVHNLRTLDVCRIGDHGRWTMWPVDDATEYLWHVSSVIRHLEQLPASTSE